jgi:hypothetical protein
MELLGRVFGHAVAGAEDLYRFLVVVDGYGHRRTAFADADECIFESVGQDYFGAVVFELGDEIVARHRPTITLIWILYSFWQTLRPCLGLAGLSSRH